MLQLQNISVPYISPQPQTQIWNTPNLTINRAQNYHIVAPSGSGKSTLVNILMGLHTQYSGTYTWQNQHTSTYTNTQWAQLRQSQISCIYQDLKLIPHLTVLQNLMLKANLSTNLKTTPQQLLQALSIQNKQNQITQTLSLGEQQRVAIARALLQPFALLLADEPFSHLDPQTAAQAQNLIQQIAHQNHATILLLDLEAKPIFTPETTLHL